jgi:hypothetical protein
MNKTTNRETMIAANTRRDSNSDQHATLKLSLEAEAEALGFTRLNDNQWKDPSCDGTITAKDLHDRIATMRSNLKETKNQKR